LEYKRAKAQGKSPKIPAFLLPKKVVPKPYVPKVQRKKSELEKKADALLAKMKLQKEIKHEKK
jgi:hypothetical protein